MKLNDIKHNHSLTDLLKVLLFSIIMCLPFLDVGTRCAYVIANKNAYQSYSGINEYQKVETNELVEGAQYYLDIETALTNVGAFDIQFDGAVNNLETNLAPSTSQLERYQISGDSTYYYLSNGNDVYTNFVGTCQFVYSSGQYDNLLPYIFKYKNNTLDNVFQYSVNKLESSPLYNWTTQTAIYSGVSTMTAQLGIQGNIIPIILCYWLFITIIYILIDIVIKLFTLLTHALGSKTA